MAYGAAEGLSNPLEEYSSYWLKFYTQGTTTPIAMATDAAAGTLLAKAEISAGGTVPIGFIKTAGDVIFIPYLNAAYDAWLFPTEAEADANDTSSAVQIADNIILVEFSTTLTTDAELVTYTAPFTGAVQQTQEEKNKESVSVLDFGIVGDGVADDTTAFNTCRTAARAIGAHILIPAGVDVRVTSQIIVYDNEVWQLDGNIIRDWTTAAADKYDKATIRNERALTFGTYAIDPGPYIPVSRNTGIKILGTGEIKNSAAVIAAIDPTVGPYAGPHLLFHASDNMHFGPITLRGPCADWATMIWGDNIHYDNTKVRDQALVFEDGFHIMGGSGHTGTVDAESGDESLALGTNYNIGISAVSMTVLADSAEGYAVKLVMNREGSTSAFGATTEKIKNIYINAVGTAGATRNGLVQVNVDATNAVYDSVEDVTLDINLSRGAGTHLGVNAYGIIMNGGKNIKMRGSIGGYLRSAILAHDISSVDFDLDIAAPEVAGYDTVNITDGADVMIGGTIESSSDLDGIELTDTTAVVTATIKEIATSAAGITANGASVVRFNGKCNKATGATGTRGIGVNSTSSEIYIGNESDLSGVDRAVEFTVDPAVYRSGYAKGLARDRTIASGNITLQGETEVSTLGEGGASDTISVLTNGQKGQTLTLRNGEAVPGTVTISVVTGGNIVLSASPYLLDDADKALELKYDGSNWQEIARY